MKLGFLFTTSLLFYGCLPRTSSDSQKQSQNDCILNSGRYPAQEVTYDQRSGSYSVMLLNAPSCLKMPLTLEAVQLARSEDSEKEMAILEFVDSTRSTLWLKPEFKLAMVSQNPETGREERSSWAPMLGAAATAVAGTMLINSLFNRPRYYTPPAPTGSSGLVQGIGGSGTTRKEAYSDYERKYTSNKNKPAASPAPAAAQNSQEKRSFFSQKPAPKSGFFQKKSSRGFFRSRRR